MSAAADERNELVVITDVVVGPIEVGGEHQQHGVRAIFVVDPPDHWRHFIYSIAPQDGTVWGFITRGFVRAPLVGTPAAEFDPTKYRWIGKGRC